MSQTITREYFHSLPGQGCAKFQLYSATEISTADIDDVRAWLNIIDRQLGRMSLKTTKQTDAEIEYQSWILSPPNAQGATNGTI